MLNTKFANWPSFTKEEADAVHKILLSNKVNYWTGVECRKFEDEFSSWCKTNYAIALANGTLALEVSLKALKIGIGDEVIVTSRSFIASASSVVNCGAKPVFADVDLSSQNIMLDSIRSLITNKTKAIICVHLAGWPCEMDEIMNIANLNKLYVIEDCAQAHGAKYKNKSVGSIGHLGCWSFCQDKIITTGGEGGMVTTNNKSLWKKIWAYKDHGKDYDKLHDFKNKKSNNFRLVHDSFGTNLRMTEMQAAIGRIQLKKIKEWNKKRLNNANSIFKVARKFDFLRAPIIPNHIRHAAYKCYVFVESGEKIRNKIIYEINKRGVPCYSGSNPEIYLERAFKNLNFKPKQRLPNAKKLGETSLMFLVHPTLRKKEIDKTCRVLEEVALKNSL